MREPLKGSITKEPEKTKSRPRQLFGQAFASPA